MTEGVPPTELADDALMEELTHLHETRTTTLRHGADDALEAHTHRTQQLEDEYLRRNPGREVDPGRTREGARSR
jgi:hypothetical protein